MSKVLVIGCGGVAGVAISKCCQVSEVFTELCIASRTKSKCDALAAKLAPITKTKITTAQVDADDVQQLCDLIQSYKPDLVMNIALPYQDLTIMDACLACGVNYMDTANYEPENTDDPEWRAIYEKRCKEAGFSAYFDYSWQWAYKKKFEEAGLTALLGCGFDPGVTQAYCAYAKKHEFDTIDTIDILDCNGGDHGYAFATNFNPEINLREVSAPGSYWENGHWVEIPAMSIKRAYTFDQVGQKDMYLLHHEEIESLGKTSAGGQAYPFLHDVRPELPRRTCAASKTSACFPPHRFTTTVRRSCRSSFSKHFCRIPQASARAQRARRTSAASSQAKRTAKRRLTTSIMSVTTRNATARSAVRLSATPPACRPCAAR